MVEPDGIACGIDNGIQPRFAERLRNGHVCSTKVVGCKS